MTVVHKIWKIEAVGSARTGLAECRRLNSCVSRGRSQEAAPQRVLQNPRKAKELEAPAVSEGKMRCGAENRLVESLPALPLDTSWLIRAANFPFLRFTMIPFTFYIGLCLHTRIGENLDSKMLRLELV